jgi:hypothetical protein
MEREIGWVLERARERMGSEQFIIEMH